MTQSEFIEKATKKLAESSPAYVEMAEKLEAAIRDLKKAHALREEASEAAETWRTRCIEVEKRLQQCQGCDTGFNREELERENAWLLSKLNDTEHSLDIARAQLDIIYLIFSRPNVYD